MLSCLRKIYVLLIVKNPLFVQGRVGLSKFMGGNMPAADDQERSATKGNCTNAGNYAKLWYWRYINNSYINISIC
jgi:hypothetical protein